MKKIILTLLVSIISILVNGQISGTIVDFQGKALNGAHILEVGTNNMGFSDSKGHFEMKSATLGSKLMISYSGFASKEVTYQGEKDFKIVLDMAAIQSQSVQIVGSRNYKRTEINTTAPVDIINVNKVAQAMGQVDVNQILQYSAPSFNASKQNGCDGTDHVVPATLRGLGPDQTLVLIDGKRYHQSSLVNIYGSRGRGNTGTDLNTIPITAIDKIEILRDGASAQYGSDAIAGVMNIILKKNTGKLTGNFNMGTNITGYGESSIPSTVDGFQAGLGLNYGIEIKDGYLNLTGEFNTKERTNRPNNTSIYGVDNSYRDKIGDSRYINTNLVANFGKKISKNNEIYTNAMFGNRNGSSYSWTVFPGDDYRNDTARFPNGLNPDIQAKIIDLNGMLGMKSMIGKTELDVYATHGFNQFRYYGHETINASLANSPTSFYCGGFGLNQTVIGTQLNRNYENIAAGFNFAGGLEYRIENYNIVAGDSNSWEQYNPTKMPGAQMIPGFTPSDASSNSRTNIGGYIDAELDVTKSFLLTGAIRLENYSDFGFTPNFKLATRYRLNDQFAIRGTVSTGFRAPSLAQLYFTNIYGDVVDGDIQRRVLATNNSSYAQAAGIAKLKQETSLNASLGITIKPAKNSTLTIDGYMVKVKDRIVLSEKLDTTVAAIQPLLTSNGLYAVKFFSNAVNTTTFGLDFVWTFDNISLFNGKQNITLTANLNSMVIDKINVSPTLAVDDTLFYSKREQSFLLGSAPSSRFLANFNQVWNRFSTNMRLSYFGGLSFINSDGKTDNYSPRVVCDLSGSYKLSYNVNWTVGVNNLFDTYPSRVNPGTSEAGTMWDASQMGIGGAYYYTKLGFTF